MYQYIGLGVLTRTITIYYIYIYTVKSIDIPV